MSSNNVSFWNRLRQALRREESSPNTVLRVKVVKTEAKRFNDAADSNVAIDDIDRSPFMINLFKAVNDDTFDLLVDFDVLAESLVGEGFSSGAEYVINETPTGMVNGVNATYTSAFNFIPESVQIEINGIDQYNPEHFVTSGLTTIIFNDSPETGDIIKIDYQKA